MSEKPFLKIYNQHCPDCGDPPRVSNRSEDYVGFFADALGEQFLFTHSRGSEKAIVRSGDKGWQNALTIKDDQIVGDLGEEPLLPAEAWLWIQSCWLACAGRQMKKSVLSQLLDAAAAEIQQKSAAAGA